MGRPPGSRSTQPVLPSGVPNETASKSRPGAGRFTFIALLKSIRCAAGLAGPSAALFAAFVADLTSCRASGVSAAETPNSKVTLAHADSIQPVGEDIETSTAQRAHLWAVALGVRTAGVGNLAGENFSRTTADPEPVGARLSPDSYLEVEAELHGLGSRGHDPFAMRSIICYKTLG